jgi:hypothetical protein
MEPLQPPTIPLLLLDVTCTRIYIDLDWVLDQTEARVPTHC